MREFNYLNLRFEDYKEVYRLFKARKLSTSILNLEKEKFFSKFKIVESSIRNTKKLKQQFKTKSFLYITSKTNSCSTNDSIKTKIIKIFKIIDKLIDKSYNKINKRNVKFFVIAIATLTTLNNDTTNMFKNQLLDQIVLFVDDLKDLLL